MSVCSRTRFAIGGEPAVVEVVAAALVNPATEPATRALLIRSVRDSRLAALPGPWLNALSALLASGHRRTVEEVMATIRAGFGPVRQGARRAEPETQPAQRAADRRARCLSGRAGPLEDDEFNLLAGSLLERSAGPLARLAAARAIGKGPVTNTQMLRIAGMLKDFSPMVLRLVLPVFAGSSDAAVGTARAVTGS